MPGYADLHIHSCFSDGTMTPREIVDAATLRGLTLIAVTDHDVLEGSCQAIALCQGTGITCLPAVELDCLDRGVNFHILGYKFDPADQGFAAFVRRSRVLLDEVSVCLVERMSKAVPGVSTEEYAAFTHDPRLGGWKALHYFMAKGLAGSLKEVIRFYGQFDCTHSAVGFPSVAEVCRAVRTAGGAAVLAHPGELIPFPDEASFTAELERLASMGLDGVECFYPTHTEEVTRACECFCDAWGLLKTVGSDCHGGFGRAAVGELRVPAERLRLP